MEQFAEKLAPHFKAIADLMSTIRREIETRADGKILKGDEIVGWLGEVYGKLLLGGVLVSDEFEHDFEADGRRVSVKARKGWRGGWRQTGVIPNIDGPGCPTHLMFVHLNDDYSPDRIWLYQWSDLVDQGRFRPFVVRKIHRGFIFNVDPSGDDSYIEYQGSSQRPSFWSAEKALLLKSRRKELGLSQQKVGDRTGIGRTRYSFLEYPKIMTQPTPSELERIIRVLGSDLRTRLGDAPQ